MIDAGLRIFQGIEEMQEDCAESIAAVLRPSTEGQMRTLVLSGGSTPRGMHRILADAPEIDWSNVHIFWGDERTVPPDHEDSNYRMAHESLLRHIDIPEENIHRMRGELDPETAAEEYEREIREVLGVPEPEIPRFDVIVLGMGADGHTASLFPGTEALDEQQRLVVANEVPQLGTTRLTMTYPLINAAHRVYFLVAGDDKDDAALQCLTDHPETPPAGLVQPSSGELQWFLDAGAAARIVKEL